MIQHRLLFHIIAPVYQWFFKEQVKGYRKNILLHLDEVGIAPQARILEAGCGTGALTQALSEQGFEVTGMDFAPGMVKQARKSGVNCFQGDLFDQTDTNVYDAVFMAFVAHGWSPEKRLELYRRAAQISNGKVIFHDYNQKRNFWISLIEWLEGGTYFSFIQNPVEEMKKVFSEVRVIEVEQFVNWYICEV